MRAGIGLLGIGFVLLAPLQASAQGAWCEANCVSLCTKIYGRAGAAPCIASIPCVNYRGRPCAPASVVNADSDDCGQLFRLKADTDSD